MKKKSVGLLEIKTAVLECFLEKTPLNPLGVKVRQGLERVNYFMAFCKGSVSNILFRIMYRHDKGIQIMLF
jgi:hypothetical protein